MVSWNGLNLDFDSLIPDTPAPFSDSDAPAEKPKQGKSARAIDRAFARFSGRVRALPYVPTVTPLTKGFTF